MYVLKKNRLFNFKKRHPHPQNDWWEQSHKPLNHIGSVMVSVLASIVVDRGFEPRSDQTKDYKRGIRCFSTNHTALMS
jgi:hypothetical protein